MSERSALDICLDWTAGAWKNTTDAAVIAAARTELAELRRKAEACDTIRSNLEKIVCTDGCDRGVVMLSYDGPTHTEIINGRTVQVYDHENFSPLGDALIELHDIAARKEAATDGK